MRDRFQSVRNHNCFSDPIQVTSSVPQGSIIGPIFFIVYAADLIMKTTQNYIKYTDDTMILQPITRDVVGSTSILRDSFDNIQRNSSAICLTKLVFFLKPKKLMPGLESISLPNVSQVSDIQVLGVTLSANLKWDWHITDTQEMQ